MRAPETPRLKAHREYLDWVAALSSVEEEAILEQCRASFIWFLRHHAWIRMDSRVTPGTAGWGQMDPWPEQIRYLRETAPYHFVLTIKARQYGFSWLRRLYLLWVSLFHPDRLCGIISLDLPLATEAIMYILQAYEKLAPFMQSYSALVRPGSNARELAFSTGSRIVSRATRKTGTVADAYTDVFVDEAHLIEAERRIDLTEMIEGGITESLAAMQGSLHVVTTGRGPFGWCYKKAKALHPGLGGKQTDKPASWWDWRCHFSSVAEHPRYKGTGEYERGLRSSTDPAIYKRERPMTIGDAFSGAGATVFNQQWLDRRTNSIRRGINNSGWVFPAPRFVTWGVGARYGNAPAIIQKEENPQGRLFKPPVNGGVYVVWADTNRGGSAKDPVAAQCLRVSEELIEQAAVLHYFPRNGIEYARVLDRFGRYYNGALVDVEANAGREVLHELVRLRYPNIGRALKTRMTETENAEDDPEAIGWVMHERLRIEMLGNLKYWHTRSAFHVYDEETLREMGVFVRRVTDRKEHEEAAAGEHDDLVISLAGAVTRAAMMLSAGTVPDSAPQPSFDDPYQRTDASGEDVTGTPLPAILSWDDRDRESSDRGGLPSIFNWGQE